MKYTTKNIMSIAALALLSVTFLAAPASAQISGAPFSFAPQNRASIAALMRSVENQNSNGGTAGVVTGTADSTITNLVCGAEGTSSAEGNSSCVIINNSSSLLDLFQESDGDQSATTTETTTVNETINGNVDGGTAADVQDILDGNAS